ncbi:MAG: chromate transporter [Clostridiales Family XIII bacterium]|jgi:chromate transporter|nr:chromate transporter [Clostridiales Family XIII bacterium]
MEKNVRNCFRLFWACVYLSALTVGGGYVIVPLMQKKFVEELGWLREDEMLSFVAIAQSAPGAIAVNTANLVGWKLMGFPGAAVALAGTILPPMVIIIIAALLYQRFRGIPAVGAVFLGMSAGVGALIMDAVCTMLGGILKRRKAPPVCLCAAAFAAAFFLHVNVVWILICAAVFGIIAGSRANSKGGGEGGPL